MILPVYVYGSNVLREDAREIGPDYPGLKELIDNMYETMYSSSGVGLAAPQVGLPIRLFVIDATRYAEDEPSLNDFKKVFINPQIIGSGEEEILMNEGCLSIPGLNEDVWRPEEITIKYFDIDFNPVEETISGYAARVVQHEYDHIEGKLFTDRLSPLRKTMLRNKLSAMAKGKYSASYKTKISK